MNKKSIFIGAIGALVCGVVLQFALASRPKTSDVSQEAPLLQQSPMIQAKNAVTSAPAASGSSQSAMVVAMNQPAPTETEKANTASHTVGTETDGKEVLPTDGKETVGKEVLPPVGEGIGQNVSQALNPAQGQAPTEFLNPKTTSVTNQLLNPPNPVNVSGPVVSAETKTPPPTGPTE